MCVVVGYCLLLFVVGYCVLLLLLLLLLFGAVCPLLSGVWYGMRLVDACGDGDADGYAPGIAARWCDGWTTSGCKCVFDVDVD